MQSTAVFALVLAASVVRAESITPPALINLNADTHRAAATGAGAGDVSVAYGNLSFSDGPVQYSTGVGQNITITVAAGYQFDSTSAVSMSCAAYGINGGAAGVAAVVNPTGAANETLTYNLTSGGTAGADVFLVTGLRVRIISAAGATAGVHDTLILNTTGVGGAINTGAAQALVAAGAAHHLAFTLQPVSATAGADLLPTVAIQDFGNNTVAGDNRVISLAIQNNPGGAVLQGNRHVLSAAGLAAWIGADDLAINVAANGYTLRASHDGAAFLGSDTVDSSAFNITAGAASHLIFSVQPNSPAAAADIITSVGALDAFNNPVAGTAVTLSLGSNPTGATLLVGSNLTKNTNASGVAVWGAADDLRINTAGTGYRLLATGATTPALSNTFNVTAGANAALRFVQQPSNTDVGAIISPNVAVEVIDAFNNRTGAAVAITLALNPNPCGGAVAGGLVNSAGGLATFNALSVNTVCAGYRLRATSPGLTLADSSLFNITQGTNLAMGSVGVDVMGAATNVTFTYSVQGAATVNQFQINIGLDKGPAPDGTADVNLVTIPIGAADVFLAPGSYTVSRDIRAALNGQVENGDRIIVSLDTTAQVAESSEADNTMSSPSLDVDLNAVDLFYNSNTTTATFTYTVSAPANVPAFNVAFYLDDAPQNGVLNVGDTLIDTAIGLATAGVHQAVANYAGNPPASAQLIFAVVDSDTPDDVLESDEGNNVDSAVNGAVTDLVAVSLTYDSNTGNAELTYLVNAPIPVGAYNIEFRLDTAAPIGMLTGADLLVATVAGMTSPGAHVLSQSYAGNLPATGQVIFATLDTGAAVVELDEGNNEADATNTAATDLVAVALSYDAPTENAQLSYTVVSPVPVAAYSIEFYLDTALPLGTLTGADTLINTVAGDTTPGAHVLVQDYSGNPPASGQVIFAVLDTGAAVAEDSEANNEVMAVNNATTDIVVNALTYDSGLQQGSLSYTVDSPVPVAAYDISFYLDDAPSNGVLDPTDTLVATVPGQTNPGLYNQMQSYAGNLPSSGQFIFAVVDVNNTVSEADEGNNEGAVANTATTDLAVNSVAVEVAGALTNVTVAYTVISPVPVAPFTIRLELDRDGNGVSDVMLVDVPVNAPASLTPGVHSITQNVRTPLNTATVQNGDTIRATLDVANTVAESDELNNTAPSSGLSVDIETTAVAVVGSNGVRARVTYRVNSPANVPPFVIRLGLDTLMAGDAGADGIISHYLDNGGGFFDFVGVQAPGIQMTIDSPNLAASLLDSTKPIVAGQSFKIHAEADATGTVREAGENGDAIIDPLEKLANTGFGADKYVVNLAISEIDPNSLFKGFSLGKPFDLEFTYRVDSNPVPPGTNFSIGVWASTAAGGINPARVPFPDRLLKTINVTLNAPAPDKQLGNHTLTATNLVIPANQFDNGDLFLKVRVDDAGTVFEGAEATDNSVDNILAVRNSGPDSDVDNDGLTAQEEADGLAIGAGMVFNANDTPDAAGAEVPGSPTLDTQKDTDGDGINDKLERDTNTDPRSADTDGDGLADGVEDANRNGIFEANLGETDPRNWDSDGDGLSDKEEVDGIFSIVRYPNDPAAYSGGSFSGRFERDFVTEVKTDPNNWDTDGDMISDWDELNTWAREAFRPADINNPTPAEVNKLGSVESIGLGRLPARIGRLFNAAGQSGTGAFVPQFPGQRTKFVWGIRTDPTMADTDGDGLMDWEDPAPQINPLHFGFDQNDDGVFDATDIEAIRNLLVSSGQISSGEVFDNVVFQRRLLNFDQDGDGFLEAPDANGDGFPDFTRFNEATIEQAYAVDFSNTGSLQDGYDVGGLGLGEVDQSGQNRFGTYRVGDAAGTPTGDGILDTEDSTGGLMASDNCPRQRNVEQRDFDGDGLGDDCDADLDNDGVPNFLDPIAQIPVTALNFPAICGFGAFNSMFGALAGMIGLRFATRRLRRRRR